MNHLDTLSQSPLKVYYINDSRLDTEINKSVTYLKENNIIDEDEDYISEIPLGSGEPQGAISIWKWGLFFALLATLTLIVNGVYRLPYSFDFIKDYFQYHIGPLLIMGGISLLALIMTISSIIQDKFFQESYDHYFITSKKICYTTNIGKPYTSINICDLESIVQYTQRYVYSYSDKSDKEEIDYSLVFTLKDGTTFKFLHINKEFIMYNYLDKIFYESNLFHKKILPVKRNYKGESVSGAIKDMLD